MNERNIRKRNIVIFNLEEKSPNLDKDQRISLERNDINELLHFISEDVPKSNLSHRLGTFNLNREKPRPIKVSLPDESAVLKVIRNCKKLKNSDKYKHISISFDKTPRQIGFYQDLKNQLIVRQNNGESNLKIKYVQGTPKIVSLN
nr:unnamed protein product [Callosobruchus analis]